MKKRLIILIAFLIIIIILLVCKLLSIKINDEVKFENTEVQEVEEKIYTEFTPVDDINTFYTVERCIQKYYDYITYNYSNAVYNILDKEYIEEEEITVDNVIKEIETKNQLTYIATSIEVKEEDYDFSTFIVEGIEFDEKNNFLNKYFIVKMNWNKSVFCIRPIDNKIEDIDIVDTINYDKNNKYNNFQLEGLSDRQIAEKYFKNIKMQCLYNSDNIFNYIDTEYLDNEFNNSKEEFIKYINENKERLINSEIANSKVEYNFENIVCTIIDNYNNSYIVTILEPMVYTWRMQ